jgi:hypothetical protein
MVAVDIYTIRLDADVARQDYLLKILSPEERERASRFHFAAHRRQSIICRGTLREILSRYLQSDPARVHFVYNRYGKPSLCDSDVRFNVSHSGEWAVLAVTAGCERESTRTNRSVLRPRADPGAFLLASRSETTPRSPSLPANRRVVPLLDTQRSLHQGTRPGAFYPIGQL